jgi:DNA-binding transcriptional ArsR family regulator
MEQAAVLKVFQSLAAKPRLDLFCRLVHAGTRGMVAGELARDLGLPSTNLSFHLKSMLAAGIVTVEPEGRFQRYRANVALMMTVLAFIAQNCAQGAGAPCAAPRPVRRSRVPRARVRPGG